MQLPLSVSAIHSQDAKLVVRLKIQLAFYLLEDKRRPENSIEVAQLASTSRK